MAQAGDQHTGAEADALRALGRPTQLHPHVWIERGRVEEEGTAVAERLRDARVLVALRGGGERTGKLDRHWYTSGLSVLITSVLATWSWSSLTPAVSGRGERMRAGGPLNCIVRRRQDRALHQRRTSSTSRLVDAPAWWWIDLAKVMLGVNHPMPWSMTVIMKVDFVGPRRRSLALDVNVLQHGLFSRRLPAGMRILRS